MFDKLGKIFSKKKETKALPQDYSVDLHSHLIPGIDDGVKTLEESISIIKQMREVGFKKIITTPHIMSHKYPNTNDTILKGCELLNEELLRQNIDIQVQAAAEYYYDEYFIKSIRNKSLLTFGNNYVLFEFSYTTQPFGVEQAVYEMLENGYKPVLAHPERYRFYMSSFDKYERLKDLGLKFQLNLNSLNQFYGKKPYLAAKYLVDNSLVDFVGSDIHSMKYLDSLKEFLQKDEIEEVFKKNQIKNMII